jgi:DNA-3-methyladenine glycosylase II
MTTPRYWPRAIRELGQADPVLHTLIRRYDGLTLRSRGDAFQTLARSIIGQQISVRAAQSVWDRFEKAAGTVTPQRIARMREPTLRACGLSGQKVNYLRDLSRRFTDGSLDSAGWHDLDDEALVADLTQVKGIGRWTAEMFMMFHLARPDVFPLGDLGLQKALSLHYAKGRPASARLITTLSRRWTPWRSVATWYLWRSLDPIPVEY